MKWWGLPNDLVGWACVAAGLVVLLAPKRALGSRHLVSLPRGRFLCSVAVASSLFSALYIQHYLRGGPRIIDATTYWLQAKTYATGAWEFFPRGPLASYNGRFLLTTPDGGLAGVFPPGYPLLLSLGVILGAPLLVGPVLAAAVSVLTYDVGRRLFDSEAVGRTASVLSVLCLTLRYHTADTMSHGWCAVLWLGAVASGLRIDAVPGQRRTTTPAIYGLIGGFCLGWLCASRPVTGLAAGAAVTLLLARSQRMWSCRVSMAWIAGTLPGVLVLLLQQHSITGEWFVSSQYAYYSRADTPAGCFRFGFGASIGCLDEHGPFVRRYLPGGYDLAAAIGTTLRRLAQHSGDAGNSPVFALLTLACLWFGRRLMTIRWLAVTILLNVVAYIPFYFDGNYPGAGARMFAEILPFEHIAVGWGLTQLGALRLGIATSLLGIAFHASHLHAQLAARDGGRPMYEARAVTSIDEPALVFVDTDHGFNLGHDPAADPSAPTVARYRGDASDHALWSALGRPVAFRYSFSTRAPPFVRPYTPQPTPRHEAEAHWPLSALTGGTVRRTHHPHCNGEAARGLELTATTTAAASHLTTSLWIPQAQRYRLIVLAEGGDVAEVCVSGGEAPRCSKLRRDGPCRWKSGALRLDSGNQDFSISWSGTVHLDALLVEAELHTERNP